jgi:hypothetical protein
VGSAVIAELDGPERIQARTRRRLEKLDEILRKWSDEQHASAELQALHARMSSICAKLSTDDAGLDGCRKFLQPAGSPAP